MARAVVLGLGSNVGAREALLRAAADLLAGTPGVGDVVRSSVVRTRAVGPAQADYLNAALLVHTALSPLELLAAARDTERRLARERRERWGPRTIDVDVLWIEGERCELPLITVPHPELVARRFALGPLLELVPAACDPASGAPYAPRLASLDGPLLDAPRALAEAFEHTIAIEHAADEGFRVEAIDRADLFAAAAEALGQLVVDPSSVSPREVVEMGVAAPDGAWPDDERLFAWLSEVLYYVDARRFAVRRAVVFGDDAQGVRGALLGEPMDEARHAIKGAVKAVTYHAMQIDRADGDAPWMRAQVVVDV